MSAKRNICANTFNSLALFLTLGQCVVGYYDKELGREISEDVLPKSEEYEDAPPLNLTMFRDTNETIWVYRTTSNVLQRCKADRTINITAKNDTFFRRFYRNSNGRIASEVLYGKFILKAINKQDPYDAMDVGKPGSSSLKDNEELIFQDLNNTCAVIKTTWLANVGGIHFTYNQRATTFELQVKNSFLRKIPLECFYQYWYSIPQPKKYFSCLH
uniref:Lipocalin n=1 Tax=Rhipicephalus appendiculatus TaxID=34631 RepID=A0A131YJE8_RHIAP